jgi:hypothetical protein
MVANTVCSYWLGSQQAGNIYQYRIILPFDDKTINVASDADGNVEGETRLALSPTTALKTNFVVSSRDSFLKLQLDALDASSAAQLEYSLSNSSSLGLSYMQAVHPCVSLGGLGQIDTSKRTCTVAAGGTYDDGTSIVTAILDSKVECSHPPHITRTRTSYLYCI